MPRRAVLEIAVMGAAQRSECAYFGTMRTLLLILLVFTLIGVVASLLAGLVNLARTDHDPRTSNRLMRYRVLFQGAALLVLALLFSLLRR